MLVPRLIIRIGDGGIGVAVCTARLTLRVVDVVYGLSVCTPTSASCLHVDFEGEVLVACVLRLCLCFRARGDFEGEVLAARVLRLRLCFGAEDKDAAT